MSDKISIARIREPQTSIHALLQQTVRSAEGVSFEAHRSARIGPRDLEPGEIIAGRHVIQESLGDTPLGQIYLARHTSISTLSYILKILKKEHVNIPELVEQFRAEATTIAQLRDAHTVRVTDMGTLPDGRPFLCREYCPGAPVDDLVRRHGALHESIVRHIAVGVLSSLAEAHSLGIVHCDIQPRGLILCEDPGSQHVRARILDFGSAHRMNALQRAENSLESHPSLLLCSPQYTAPEHLRGHTVAASDVYSLGLTLAELLDGVSVFERGSFLAVSAMQLAPSPPPLGAKARASQLAPILRRATAKNLDERYRNAGEMLRDLLETILPVDDEFRRSLSLEFIERHTRPLKETPDTNRASVAHNRASEFESDPIWAAAGALLENAPTAPRHPLVSGDAPRNTGDIQEFSTDDHLAAVNESAPHVNTRRSSPSSTGVESLSAAAPMDASFNEEFSAPITDDFFEHHTNAVRDARKPSMRLDVSQDRELPSSSSFSPSITDRGTAIMRKSQLDKVTHVERLERLAEEERKERYSSEHLIARPLPLPESMLKRAVLSRPVDILLRVLLVLAFLAVGSAILLSGIPS